MLPEIFTSGEGCNSQCQYLSGWSASWERVECLCCGGVAKRKDDLVEVSRGNLALDRHGESSSRLHPCRASTGAKQISIWERLHLLGLRKEVSWWW